MRVAVCWLEGGARSQALLRHGQHPALFVPMRLDTRGLLPFSLCVLLFSAAVLHSYFVERTATRGSSAFSCLIRAFAESPVLAQQCSHLNCAMKPIVAAVCFFLEAPSC